MSDDGKIIPFGKYKGQEIELVRQRDPQYLQWLTQQAWFAEKFQPIYQIVVNNFALPSEDTPEHNAIQVRFLEHDFRHAFWLAADLVEESDREYLQRDFERRTREVRHAPKPFEYLSRKKIDEPGSWTHNMLKLHRERVRRQWAVWRKVRGILPIEVIIGPAKFEDTTDVAFNITLRIGLAGYEEFRAYRGYRLGIEIKPSMGDDYPAVLRQIKRQRSSAACLDERRPSHWFLLLDQFAASNVTLDQVRQIFAQDNIRVVLVSDIKN